MARTFRTQMLARTILHGTLPRIGSPETAGTHTHFGSLADLGTPDPDGSPLTYGTPVLFGFEWGQIAPTQSAASFLGFFGKKASQLGGRMMWAWPRWTTGYGFGGSWPGWSIRQHISQ